MTEAADQARVTKAGIQSQCRRANAHWTPAFAGVTNSIANGPN
jgi:hypothetical protein